MSNKNKEIVMPTWRDKQTPVNAANLNSMVQSIKQNSNDIKILSQAMSLLNDSKLDKVELQDNILKFYAKEVVKFSIAIPTGSGEIGIPGQDGRDGREIELRKGKTHIEWNYVGEDNWKQLVSIEELKGQKGQDGQKGDAGTPGKDGQDGANGKEIELRKGETHIEWNYVGEESWEQLIALEDLKGQDGIPGINGQDGESPNLEIGNVSTLEPGSRATANVRLISENRYAIDLGIPRGAKGQDGTGGGSGSVVNPTLEIGSVTSGEVASAEIVGDSPNYTINLVLPKGEQGLTGERGPQGKPGAKGERGLTGEQGPRGEQGPQGERGLTGERGAQGEKGNDGVTPNIKIGEVTTLEAGQQATVTKTGTKENPVFNFGIPKGQDGSNGDGSSILDLRDPLPGEIFEIANAPLPPAATYGNIVLSKTSITIVEGQSDTFTVKLDKAPTNNQIVRLSKNNDDVTLSHNSLTFTSNNYNTPQTITVSVAEDEDYSNESCTITLSSPNVSNKTLEVSITDNDKAPSNIPVQSITLNHSESTLQVNKTLQLTPIFNPSEATNKNVTWDSSNKGFATVSPSGLVTGVGEGSCTITCTTQDGNKTASCNLQIENNQETHDGYIKENLKAYYNFTKYPDGYSGNVEDLSGNNLIPNVTGLEYYTTGRNGIINGSLMLNTHKTTATQLEIPTDSSFTTYPFSIELFAAFRIYYNMYKPDNELVFGDETITNHFIINTREGGTTGNGYFIRASENGDIDIVGTLSQPLITGIHSELNIANSKNPILKYQHLVIVIDRNLQKVYINGNLISETNQGSIVLDGSNRVMKICQNILKANLKLVRLYNSVLNDEQVLQNYNDTIKIME